MWDFWRDRSCLGPPYYIKRESNMFITSILTNIFIWEQKLLHLGLLQLSLTQAGLSKSLTFCFTCLDLECQDCQGFYHPTQCSGKQMRAVHLKTTVF